MIWSAAQILPHLATLANNPPRATSTIQLAQIIVTSSSPAIDLTNPIFRGLAIFGAYLGLPSGDPLIILARLIRAALGLIGIILLFMVLYAGILWMTSGGNEEKVTKAKRTLINAIIGIIIILLAQSIVLYVIKLLGAVE